MLLGGSGTVKIQLLAIVVLGGLMALPSSLYGQEAKHKLTDEEKKIQLEERRKQAHQEVFESFKELKAAYAAKKKADCGGTDEEKRKADREYLRARGAFEIKVDLEALASEAVQQAYKEAGDAEAESIAAKKDTSIPDAYKEEAAKNLRKPSKKQVRSKRKKRSAS